MLAQVPIWYRAMKTRMAAGMIVQITSRRWLPWKYWPRGTGWPWASFWSAYRYEHPDQDHLGSDEHDPRDDENDQEKTVDFPTKRRDDVEMVIGGVRQPPVGRERSVEKRSHAEQGRQGKQDAPVTHGKTLPSSGSEFECERTNRAKSFHGVTGSRNRRPEDPDSQDARGHLMKHPVRRFAARRRAAVRPQGRAAGRPTLANGHRRSFRPGGARWPPRSNPVHRVAGARS